MKVLLDFTKPLTIQTYCLYVNSAIPTYIEMALPTDEKTALIHTLVAERFLVVRIGFFRSLESKKSGLRSI